jgi:hypothetical protein
LSQKFHAWVGRLGPFRQQSPTTGFGLLRKSKRTRSIHKIWTNCKQPPAKITPRMLTAGLTRTRRQTGLRATHNGARTDEVHFWGGDVPCWLHTLHTLR